MQLLKSPAFSELYAGERETSAPGLRHADGVSDTKNRDDLEVALSAWVEAVPLPHETVEEIYQSMIDRIRGRGNVVPLAVVEEA
jgi:hypothetical protein